ncbi:hypothetical protein [Pseudarthrobacter sp. NBSH8]|uniref:hypothetical protein n=1 Tax=Pseudarthrobacter sp. NBSH8 TaxID=2596911 RepID=UPI001629E808|nr:hypothetical protein [Pseudarthrobacter sp. NBSH8]QNE14587.1 hypothetical protein FYJ92_09255 [Pseudarthrobacter sp. NBSH8]
MSADPASARAPRHVFNVVGSRAGHTKVTAHALTKVIEVIAADAFDIPPDRVTVDIQDAKGRLGISAAVAVVVPSLLQAAHRGPSPTDETVYARAARARSVIIDRIGQVAGADVDRVDITVHGIHRPPKARVQ